MADARQGMSITTPVMRLGLTEQVYVGCDILSFNLFENILSV
jgi:hypothetical protein